MECFEGVQLVMEHTVFIRCGGGEIESALPRLLWDPSYGVVPIVLASSACLDINAFGTHEVHGALISVERIDLQILYMLSAHFNQTRNLDTQ